MRPSWTSSRFVTQIRAMYREVARDPAGDFHFEMGRGLAERLGYPAQWLDAVPAEALASFAGVGHMIDLAELAPGDRVVDLGSGSGTDAFVAAHLVGPDGERRRGRHDRASARQGAHAA